MIDGMVPADGQPFKSKLGKDFSVTLTEPGFYGIKCSPHYAMGMAMAIEVGPPSERDLPSGLPGRARDCFEAILRTVE